MSPIVRRSLLLLIVLAAGACGGLATEPAAHPVPNAVQPHFDDGDTTSGGIGYTLPHG